MSAPKTLFWRQISSLILCSRTAQTYNSNSVVVYLPTAKVCIESRSANLNFLAMESNEIKNFLKGLPLWLRLAVLVVLAVAVGFGLSSCANTKAVVRSSADNTTSSITITTNNPTNVTVTNKQDSLGLNFNPKK